MNEIENLKIKATLLREQIDKDLDKYNDEELRNMKVSSPGVGK